MLNSEYEYTNRETVLISAFGLAQSDDLNMIWVGEVIGKVSDKFWIVKCDKFKSSDIGYTGFSAACIPASILKPLHSEEDFDCLKHFRK